MHAKDAGAAVVDDIGEVFRGQTVIDGNQHGADLGHGIKRLELRVRVRSDIGNAIPTLDSHLLQGGRPAVAAREKLPHRYSASPHRSRPRVVRKADARVARIRAGSERPSCLIDLRSERGAGDNGDFHQLWRPPSRPAIGASSTEGAPCRPPLRAAALAPTASLKRCHQRLTPPPIFCRNAQIAAICRGLGELIKSTHGRYEWAERRESGRRRYGQDAPNAGFPRLHTERASSTLFRRSGEHGDGTEARDRFGPIVAADATSFPPSALHLDRLC